MYIRITEEDIKMMDTFSPYMVGFPPKLSDDAPEEVVVAYKKFKKIGEKKFNG